MERDEITRDDFAVVRRGWDPDEVRAHLSAVAAAFEERAGSQPERSLGDYAAGQVRGVLEAAEQAAAEVRAGADAEAGRRIAEAEAEAERIVAAARVEATAVLAAARADADAHVASAREAVEGLVGQAEGLLGEVTSIGERVSATAPPGDAPAAVSATAAGYPRRAAEAGDAGEPALAPALEPDPPSDGGSAPAPEPAAPAAGSGQATTTEELIAQLRAGAAAELTAIDPASASEPDAGAAVEPDAVDAGAAVEPAAEPDPGPGMEPDAGAAGASTEDSARGDDLGAVRLVAMNLALEGSSREAIVTQLRDEFGPIDGLEGLLDDVLARAGR